MVTGNVLRWLIVEALSDKTSALTASWGHQTKKSKTIKYLAIIIIKTAV